MNKISKEQEVALNAVAEICYNNSVSGGWWHDINTGLPLVRNKLEMLFLIHSEVSEAGEGVRKGINDDHLPHRLMEEVELADVLIRLFDYAKGHNLDVIGAMIEKIEYNTKREDHKVENRKKAGGKKM